MKTIFPIPHLDTAQTGPFIIDAAVIFSSTSNWHLIIYVMIIYVFNNDKNKKPWHIFGQVTLFS